MTPMELAEAEAAVWSEDGRARRQLIADYLKANPKESMLGVVEAATAWRNKLKAKATGEKA